MDDNYNDLTYDVNDDFIFAVIGNDIESIRKLITKRDLNASTLNRGLNYSIENNLDDIALIIIKDKRIFPGEKLLFKILKHAKPVLLKELKDRGIHISQNTEKKGYQILGKKVYNLVECLNIYKEMVRSNSPTQNIMKRNTQ